MVGSPPPPAQLLQFCDAEHFEYFPPLRNTDQPFICFSQEAGVYLHGPFVAHKGTAAINQTSGGITEGRKGCT